jgi:hypothetical protein
MVMNFPVLEQEIFDHMSDQLWPYMTQLDIRLFSLLITSVFNNFSRYKTVHRRGYCIDFKIIQQNCISCS